MTARLYDVLSSITVESGVGANIRSPDGRALQGLDTRIAKAIAQLTNPEVKNLADLTSHSYDDLVSIPQFAICSLRKVAETLGLLGTELPGVWPNDYWPRWRAARRKAKKAI